MIKYSVKKIKPYGDHREIDAFIIDPPYQDLNIIKGITDTEDLDLEIKWIEDELLGKMVPDYSLPGEIIHQPILWGTEKSRIASWIEDRLTGLEEFDTRQFLEVCCAWRTFLVDQDKK